MHVPLPQTPYLEHGPPKIPTSLQLCVHTISPHIHASADENDVVTKMLANSVIKNRFFNTLF